MSLKCKFQAIYIVQYILYDVFVDVLYHIKYGMQIKRKYSKDK